MTNWYYITFIYAEISLVGLFVELDGRRRIINTKTTLSRRTLFERFAQETSPIPESIGCRHRRSRVPESAVLSIKDKTKMRFVRWTTSNRFDNLQEERWNINIFRTN